MDYKYEVTITDNNDNFMPQGYEKDIEIFINDDLNYGGNYVKVKVKQIENLNQDDNTL